MTTISQSITPLPAAPDPATQTPAAFSTTAAAFVLAQKDMAVELETFRGQVNTVAGEMELFSDNAEAAAAAAATASGAALWVSGTSYTTGQCTFSPTNYQTYRRITNGAGTTDPISDATNWTKISAGGAVRASTAASITSPLAWNSNLYEMYIATAQAGALTINADSGSPVNGQKMLFRLLDNGTARALTWTTGSSKSFRAVGVSLPTTTVINKTLYIGCIFNSTADRWDVIAVGKEV